MLDYLLYTHYFEMKTLSSRYVKTARVLIDLSSSNFLWQDAPPTFVRQPHECTTVFSY